MNVINQCTDFIMPGLWEKHRMRCPGVNKKKDCAEVSLTSAYSASYSYPRIIGQRFACDGRIGACRIFIRGLNGVEWNRRSTVSRPAVMQLSADLKCLGYRE